MLTKDQFMKLIEKDTRMLMRDHCLSRDEAVRFGMKAIRMLYPDEVRKYIDKKGPVR